MPQWTKEQLIALVRQTARKYGIDEKIAVAQINQESGFRPNVGSSAGAYGIAQFMPATAARFGVNRADPVSSMEGWGKYMTFLLKRYKGNYSQALAGYNAGEGNVDKAIKRGATIPSIPETVNYVKSILGNAGKAISGAWEINTSPFAASSGQLDSVGSFFSQFFGRSQSTQTFAPKEVSKDERRKVILFIAGILIVIVIGAYIAK